MSTFDEELGALVDGLDRIYLGSQTIEEQKSFQVVGDQIDLYLGLLGVLDALT